MTASSQRARHVALADVMAAVKFSWMDERARFALPQSVADVSTFCGQRCGPLSTTIRSLR
jgi:hypothetical protein